MDKSLDISVVVPLYNERESLAELVAWIDRVARENNLSYEVIMVDDGYASHAITASRPHCTAGLRRPRERWSSRWMPTFKIRPTRFPRCGA